MPEQNRPFVVTDRRKFTMDGELRPDADPSPERESRAPEPVAEMPPVATPEPTPQPEPEAAAEREMPAGPTADQSMQANAAYQATVERLDTAIRAANPGMEHPLAMSFDQLIQSFYMTSIMQLGGNTPEGQQPQIDLMGARQSIDMLSVLAEKTKSNLSKEEDLLLDSALFELRMAFLEVTQALARSAAAKNPPPSPGRPSIVR
jgi:hypothetical protein